MNVAQISASERFIQAMGPMIEDECKMQKVILFIQSLNYEEECPRLSYDDLDDCIPLDVAFSKIRENVKDSYGIKS